MLPNIPFQTKWNKLVPIKVNVFIWRLVLDRLPFPWNLSRRGMDIPFLDCLICDTGTNMLPHLFFQCEVARDLAGLLCCWWRLPVTSCDSFQEWSDWFVSLAQMIVWKLRFLLVGGSYGVTGISCCLVLDLF